MLISEKDAMNGGGGGTDFEVNEPGSNAGEWGTDETDLAAGPSNSPANSGVDFSASTSFGGGLSLDLETRPLHERMGLKLLDDAWFDRAESRLRDLLAEFGPGGSGGNALNRDLQVLGALGIATSATIALLAALFAPIVAGGATIAAGVSLVATTLTAAYSWTNLAVTFVGSRQQIRQFRSTSGLFSPYGLPAFVGATLAGQSTDRSLSVAKPSALIGRTLHSRKPPDPDRFVLDTLLGIDLQPKTDPSANQSAPPLP